MHLLLVATPRPLSFFYWIVGLVTLLLVLFPFSTSAPLSQKVATAAVDLVIGFAIGSLLNGVGPAPPAAAAAAPRRAGLRRAVRQDPYGQWGPSGRTRGRRTTRYGQSRPFGDWDPVSGTRSAEVSRFRCRARPVPGLWSPNFGTFDSSELLTCRCLPHGHTGYTGA